MNALILSYDFQQKIWLLLRNNLLLSRLPILDKIILLSNSSI